tara:strand:+ start:1184 stop:1519 length:336 start_codon:yes stop_codon:yes gene_type:complete
MTIATKITQHTLDNIPDMILMRGNEDVPADAIRAFIEYFQEGFPDADVYAGTYYDEGMFAQAMYETDSTVMDLDPIIYSAINFKDVAYDLLIDDFVQVSYHDQTYYFRSTW